MQQQQQFRLQVLDQVELVELQVFQQDLLQQQFQLKHKLNKVQ